MWFAGLRPRGTDLGLDLLREAEAAWQFLENNGYAPQKRTNNKQDKGASHYDRLSDDQKRYFDAFWDAFAYKEGKQRAAIVWGHLSPGTEKAIRIVQAAAVAAELRRQNPDKTPCMAEKWLNERRWEDGHEKPKKHQSHGEWRG